MKKSRLQSKGGTPGGWGPDFRSKYVTNGTLDTKFLNFYNYRKMLQETQHRIRSNFLKPLNFKYFASRVIILSNQWLENTATRRPRFLVSKPSTTSKLNERKL